jgi:tetratricopeptide (TPR) repeat protein
MTASVLYFGRLATKHHLGIAAKAGIPCLLVAMGCATFSRNLVWRSNLALYSDTVKKSPDFSKAWEQLGLAYYDKNDFHNAEIYLAKACALYTYTMVYDERTDLNLASIYVVEGKNIEAEKMYKKALKNSNGRNQKVLIDYIEFLTKKLSTEKEGGNVAAIKGEISKRSEMLYALDGKPSSLYRAAMLALDLGDKRKAIDCFSKIYEKSPQGDRYKELAKEQLARL